MKISKNIIHLFTLIFFIQAYCQSPVLLLSDSDAAEIRLHLTDNALLKHSYEYARQTADLALKASIDVPIPKDNGGGYTHEKHKQNYRDMYAAAVTYKISGEKKYAAFVETMLLKYAAMYPKLGLHPFAPKNQFAGKLFWQSLNDYVWVVYSIQAYDLVRGSIDAKNRNRIDNDVFRAMAKFISKGDSGLKMFNMIHNHGTWALAAVGMTGYVLHDKDMVARALYGSNKDGNTGFIKQIDTLFSPDGYYSEGPYYERYALQPFMVFAAAIQNNQPEIKIFEHRNGLLGKAVQTLFQMTDSNGRILPFNDALKEKDITTEELIASADIAYANYHNKTLLPVIKKQNTVLLTQAGLAAARAADKSNDVVYKLLPAIISDGPTGKSGGVALLRTEADDLSLIFKYTAQGMNHGHFDRLGIQLYHKKNEILTDYGAVRFINIEAKNGGRYMKETDSYAKQSIAHSTLIVDETSHYSANWQEAEKYAPRQVFAYTEGTIQIACAKDSIAYKDVSLLRTVTLVTEETPFIIDIFKAASTQPHKFDLNFMYSGQVMETNFKYTPESALKPLGTAHGYQHIRKVASGAANNGLSQFTWLNKNTFYTISTLTDVNCELIFTTAGANDPEFNLRNETGYLIRTSDSKSKTFVSIIEPHGSFEPVPELVNDSHTGVEKIQLLVDTENYTAVSITKNGKQYLFFLAYNGSENSMHSLRIDNKEHTWKGHYILKSTP